MTPVVSIIIPHFNRTQLLAETLASVAGQTHTGWEVIVVDDGSTNEEWQALQAFASHKVRVLQRSDGKKGPSRCRNIGAAQAQGKYLIFLDSDDLLAPFCLEGRVKIMEREPNASLAVFPIQIFKERPGDTNQNFGFFPEPDHVAGCFLRNDNPWQTMAPIWQRQFFLSLGGFDEQFLFMEDPDVHLRAVLASADHIIYCSDSSPDCYYRVNHQDGTKSSFWKHSIQYRIAFYNKVMQAGYLPAHRPDLRAAVKTGIYQLVRTFLYHRKNEFPEFFRQLMDLLQTTDYFSTAERLRLQYLIAVGNAEGTVARMLRLRGLCYRLLP